MESLNMKDLIYKDKNGNIVKNPEEYFAALEKDVLVEEKLQVGDIVKLKNFDDRIEILYCDFEIPYLGISDYAGKNLDHPSDELTLFNQNNIESYEKRKNHGK